MKTWLFYDLIFKLFFPHKKLLSITTNNSIAKRVDPCHYNKKAMVITNMSWNSRKGLLSKRELGEAHYARDYTHLL